MTLMKSKINSLVWLKSAIYISVVGGVILSSNSASAIGLTLVNANLQFSEGIVDFSGTLPLPVWVNFSETPTFATMSLVGGPFSMTYTTSFKIRGDFWQGSFSINQFTRYFDNDYLSTEERIDDYLSLVGNFQHITDPHPGDDSFGNIFTFGLVLEPEDAIGNTITTRAGNSLDHPGINHSDRFNAELTATVESLLFGGTRIENDIRKWNFNLTAQHVPEPTTIFGSALALSLGGWLKRKKSSQHNKTSS